MDLVAELTTPDIAWFPALPGAVEAEGYRGRECIETYFGEVEGTWEELLISIDELRDLGDVVLLLGRTKGRGRASGVEVNAPIGIAYDVRGHKVSRCRAFLNHADALKAVGLEVTGQIQVSGERAKSANARHECFVMDASVSVNTAETVELDDQQQSARPRQRLLLSP